MEINMVNVLCPLIFGVIMTIIIYQILFGKDFEDWLVEQLLPFFAYLLAFSFNDPDGFIVLSILTEKMIDNMECEELNKFMENINKWFWRQE